MKLFENKQTEKNKNKRTEVVPVVSVVPIATVVQVAPGGEGGTLGISGWGCATGTLEPLTYSRASSAKFCYPILE